MSCAPGDVVSITRHRREFWLVAFAFLTVMAMGTVPSPLYGLYRARDHFSLFMVTVAFATYAVGVIGALLLAGHLSDVHGRRQLLLPSVGVAIVSAGATRAQLIASAVNVGGLGVGALVAGLLAEWVAKPLTVPYLVFVGALRCGRLRS